MTNQDAPRELMPFQPANMTPAQLAAVSFLARYSGPTHHLYAYQLRRWFAWCETNRIDALIGVERHRGVLPHPTAACRPQRIQASTGQI